MKKPLFKWKNLSRCFRAFLFVALAFFLLGFGTLGTVRGTGNSYELQTQISSVDAQSPDVVFHLTAPKDGEGNDITVRLYEVYLNVGTIYSNAPTASLRLTRSTSETGNYSSRLDTTLENPASSEEAGSNAVRGAAFNWIAPFDLSGWRSSGLTSYPYFKLIARTSNLLINEVVFVGEIYNGVDGTGRYTVIPAEIDFSSNVPVREGERKEDALSRAAALLDSQYIPSLAQSSFFRYGEEEAKILSAVSEIRAGGSYLAGDVYHGETAYYALGLDLVTLGTLIFGTSPFGLRFFPMLASFGILLVGYFFVKRLFKSEKAGLIFSVLYALCGLSMSLAHFAAPITIGLFFFLSSLSLCHMFYVGGMKAAKPSATLPLFGAGLLSAFAILVNGAFVVPVLGVCGLFGAGMVRQQKARRHYLDAALSKAEGATGEEVQKAKADVAAVVREYRYKNVTAPIAFGVSLLLGALVFSLLAMLPASFAFVKLLDNPVSPACNIFALGWRAFAAAFSVNPSVWNLFYPLFVGAGETYAVTGAMINVAALLAGAFGLVFAVYRIISILAKKRARESRAELRSSVILLAGLVLSLVTASFTAGGLTFIFAAYAFAFALASGGAVKLQEKDEKTAADIKFTLYFWLGLLCVCFLLFAVFTFSIPLPATFLSKIFG